MKIVRTKKKLLNHFRTSWLPKSEYYSKLSMKQSNPETSSKAYWSIWKSFVKDKKYLSFPFNTTMVISLPIFTKRPSFLTPFLQNNALYYRRVVNFQPTQHLEQTSHDYPLTFLKMILSKMIKHVVQTKQVFAWLKFVVTHYANL